MTTAIVCPNCQAKVSLRATNAPRIRCHHCRKGFPNPVATVVPVAVLSEPLAPSGQVEPQSPELSALQVSLSDSAPQFAAIVSLSGTVPQIAADPATKQVAEATPSESFTSAPTQSQPRRPGGRERQRKRWHLRKLTKLQPVDYIVAMAVIVGFVALLGAGWYIFGPDGYPQRPKTTDDAPPDIHIPASAPALTDTSTVTSLAPRLTSPAAPQTLSHRLVGIWDLRADEDRDGTMEFRADGAASIRAISGGREQPADILRWHVVSEDGDRLVIELGGGAGDLGNMQVHLVMTSPDAFTIERAILSGIARPEVNRFVRRAPVAVAVPPHVSSP